MSVTGSVQKLLVIIFFFFFEFCVKFLKFVTDIGQRVH